LNYTLSILVVLVGSSLVRAAPPAREGVLRPSDRVNARGERQTNMKAVEAARDRGDGRITPEAEWELDRIDAWQDRRYVPGRDFQLFDQARDRQLRVEAREARARARAVARPADDAGPAGLGIAPGDLAPRGAGGLSPLAAQLHEDEQTLGRADADLAAMLRQLDDAEARELRSLRGRLDREDRGGEYDAAAAKIRADYAKWRGQARAEHQRVRSRLRGAGKG
jgi:hypothetical protein